MRLFFSLIFICYFANLGAQTLVRIKDGAASDPIPYASVKFLNKAIKSKDILIANDKGELILDFKEIAIIQVSSNGYSSRVDTITAGKSKDIFLSFL